MTKLFSALDNGGLFGLGGAAMMSPTGTFSGPNGLGSSIGGLFG